MKSDGKKLGLRFAEAGERQKWWRSKKIVVAVSGGGDSMAMLRLLVEFFPGELVVAHLDHGIRRGSSWEDSLFVKKFCDENGVKIHVRQGDVPRQKLPGESLEMAGRRIRYAFLEEVRAREGCEHIATGHTADDVVETCLMNLFRGAGLRGLVGIRGARGNIIRPVIGFRRAQLRAILADYATDWREDETNADTTYVRNRVRGELLPWLRERLNENVDARLLNLSAMALSEEEAREERSGALLRWLERMNPVALCCWDAKLAREIREGELAEALRAQGRELSLPALDRGRTEQLCRLIRESNRWRFQWSGTTEVCGCGKAVAWVDRGDLTPPEPQRLALRMEGAQRVQWGRWNFEILPQRENASYFGDLSAKIPWDGASSLEISSVLEYIKMRHREADCAHVSWWARAQWPMLSFLDQARWIPGGSGMTSPHLEYVIIVRSVV